MKTLRNHTSYATAFKAENQQIKKGVLGTIFYWVETTPNKGDRVCKITYNPTTKTYSKITRSAYALVTVLAYNKKTNTVQSQSCHIHKPFVVRGFVNSCGGIKKFTKAQRQNFISLYNTNLTPSDFNNSLQMAVNNTESKEKIN